MTTKLEKLLEKEAQLKAQIQQAKAAERTLEKKKDTRRKVLIGAAVMARVERGEWPEADLKMMMDGFLSRPHERALFDLDSDDSGSDRSPSDGQRESVAASRQKSSSTHAKKSKSSAATTATQKKKVRLPESVDDLVREFNL